MRHFSSATKSPEVRSKSDAGKNLVMSSCSSLASSARLSSLSRAVKLPAGCDPWEYPEPACRIVAALAMNSVLAFIFTLEVATKSAGSPMACSPSATPGRARPSGSSDLSLDEKVTEGREPD